MKNHPHTPLAKAISIVDGVANLAAACKVSKQAVYKWIERGHPPIGKCAAVERAAGGKVTRFELLPPDFSNAPGAEPR